MQAIDFVHPWVLQHSGLNHGFGPPKHFLSRLEEKDRRTGDFHTSGREDFGEGDANSGVPVMPTGVHHPGRA